MKLSDHAANVACPAGHVACETSVGNQKDLLLHFIFIFYILLLECRKVEYFESDLIPFECRFINHEQSVMQHAACGSYHYRISL